MEILNDNETDMRIDSLEDFVNEDMGQNSSKGLSNWLTHYLLRMQTVFYL